MKIGREVVILSGARTAIGDYGGALKEKAPTELAAIVVREAVRRAGIEPAEVGHVAIGNVIHTDIHDMYLSRVAAVRGGLPVETPAVTVNRVCGSGLQAIITAAQAIELGLADVTVGGGTECMSKAPYWLPAMRWGQRMNNGITVDPTIGGITDPFEDKPMGATAETVARRWEITREAQDQMALDSHRRAAQAIAEDRFKEQIVPIEIVSRKQTIVFDTDEHVRADTSLEALARLRPVFDKSGTITAGNASSLADGAGAVVLMDRERATERGLKPLGRLVDYAFAGVDPEIMGIGPVPAVQSLLKKTGLSIGDLDIIELNEAFASTTLASMAELKLPWEKTNPNGGGVALGHPIGASGAIMAIKALYELARTGGRYGSVTMCIGGGQGIAALFERI